MIEITALTIIEFKIYEYKFSNANFSIPNVSLSEVTTNNKQLQNPNELVVAIKKYEKHALLGMNQSNCRYYHAS